MREVWEVLHREFVYLWYYFDIQLRQIFGYWVLGMVIGSAISVFAKDKLHRLFGSLSGMRLGALGVIPASLLGIASPLCMYGTIPIAASFSRGGMRHDWLAAFMMSSILLNPQLILYSGALGGQMLAIRIISCCLCGEMASRPLEAMALIALGFRKLSMNITALGAVKAMILSLNVKEATEYLNSQLNQPVPSLRERLRFFALDHNIVIS